MLCVSASDRWLKRPPKREKKIGRGIRRGLAERSQDHVQLSEKMNLG